VLTVKPQTGKVHQHLAEIGSTHAGILAAIDEHTAAAVKREREREEALADAAGRAGPLGGPGS
jgi:hypothetical protein